MLPQVYSATEPAAPRRAILCAVGLFVVALAFAAGLTWNRTHGVLGDSVQVPEWRASFRPPAEFTAEGRVPTALGRAYRFSAMSPEGATLILEVQRTRLAPGTDPAALCQEVLARRVSLGARLVAGPERLGNVDGLELYNAAAPASATAVARAVVLGTGDAYVVSLATDGRQIGGRDYRIFRRVCHSMAFDAG